MSRMSLLTGYTGALCTAQHKSVDRTLQRPELIESTCVHISEVFLVLVVVEHLYGIHNGNTVLKMCKNSMFFFQWHVSQKIR